jgi:hypothetical protein
MKRISLLALGISAVLVIPTAPAARAAALTNTFERSAAGSAYTKAEWSKDGWNASFDVGMSNRTMIDTSTKRSGTKSLRVFYPKGQINPESSGASSDFRVPKAREYWLRQWIRFSSDFSWGTTEFGGKIGLGLAGGARCSGGIPCDGYNGFTSRFIWGRDGKASIYYYHMGHTGQYGDYMELKPGGGGTYYWPRGQWIEIKQRVKVNTVSGGNAVSNGEIETWVNGQNAGLRTGLQFVRNGDLVDTAYFSSFFGGNTYTFAPTRDSYIWYDDVRASTTPI